METRRCVRCGKVPADGWYSKSGYCRECAEAILDAQNTAAADGVSQKDWLVTLLLAIFVGALGVHRFYTKKIGTGILWLLTGGCLWIGALVDVIMIATSTFKDGDGLLILSDSKKREMGISTTPVAVQAAPAKVDQSQGYLDQLAQLAQLKESGVITAEEFEQKKAQLLNKIG